MDFAARQRLFEGKASPTIKKTPEQVKADQVFLAECIRVEGILKRRSSVEVSVPVSDPVSVPVSEPEPVNVSVPVSEPLSETVEVTKPRFADALLENDSENNEIIETNPVITKKEPEITDNPLCGDEFVQVETKN